MVTISVRKDGVKTTRMMVLQQVGSPRLTEIEHMRFKTTKQQKYNNHEENPQVRKTDVDAVHESCLQRSSMKEL